MVFCAPWAEYFINNKKTIYQNIGKKKDAFSWKALDHSLNNGEGLTQWYFMPLGTTLNYTTPNLNTLREFLEYNQYIDWNRWNH